ncbi:MAG: hypothetical protein LDL11_01785 [Desulfarculus sp.]|nr:hypothetical protein [Desulfarculus sp.]
MRYFGKDGPQCQLPELEPAGSVGKCRRLVRAVLFGRVPRGAVLWLGLGVVVMALFMWFWSVACVSESGRSVCRDAAAAISIRR